MVKPFEYCFDDMKTGGSMYQFKIKNANRFLVFFIITIFIIALPLGADARGIFTLKPILTASWETDDNLYKLKGKYIHILYNLVLSLDMKQEKPFLILITRLTPMITEIRILYRQGHSLLTVRIIQAILLFST